MSADYAIEIVLDLSFDETNISEILVRGYKKGFIYYDHIMGERYEDAPILTPSQAAKKIIIASQNKIEGGPSVFVNIGDTFAFFWFYKTDDGYLEFRIGGFSAAKKKNGYIDFYYYLKTFLDLCKDFVMMSIKAYSF